MILSNSRAEEIARNVQKTLIDRGYGRVWLVDLKEQINCICNSIDAMGRCDETRDAYAPIKATAYYRANGGAYLAAQDLIFSEPDIISASYEAAKSRRVLMIEAGVWTDQHEYWFRANYEA